MLAKLRSRWHRLRARLTCWHRGHDWIPIWIRLTEKREPDGKACKRCWTTRLGLNALLAVMYLPGLVELLNQPRILSRYMSLNPRPAPPGKPVVTPLQRAKKPDEDERP